MHQWSGYPGLHERHLQRRHNNPIFPKERRTICQEDIEKAKSMDAQTFDSVRSGFEEFSMLVNDTSGNDESLLWDKALLERCDKMIISLIVAGESLKDDLSKAFRMEEKLMSMILKKYPETHKFMTAYHLFKMLKRVPVIADYNYRFSPIQKPELVHAILSEDLASIRICGFFFKYNNPGYLPHPRLARQFLARATVAGMERITAEEIEASYTDGGFSVFYGWELDDEKNSSDPCGDFKSTILSRIFPPTILPASVGDC